MENCIEAVQKMCGYPILDSVVMHPVDAARFNLKTAERRYSRKSIRYALAKRVLRKLKKACK